VKVLDILRFKHFIAVDVLITVYYVGALVVPVALWWGRGALIKRFETLARLDVKVRSLYASMTLRNRIYAGLLLVGSFLMMELMWRMMFETVIAYFQMREYLEQLTH